ncbi:hypothetical protein [Actinomadura coerulea]|uniref:hypothetical protein n=1 Tax=Actinomadura coerulea TaxID=46159 RepID=UPI003432A33C
MARPTLATVLAVMGAAGTILGANPAGGGADPVDDGLSRLQQPIQAWASALARLLLPTIERGADALSVDDELDRLRGGAHGR